MCPKVVSCCSTSDICPIFQTICYDEQTGGHISCCSITPGSIGEGSKNLFFTIYWFCKVKMF